MMTGTNLTTSAKAAEARAEQQLLDRLEEELKSINGWTSKAEIRPPSTMPPRELPAWKQPVRPTAITSDKATAAPSGRRLTAPKSWIESRAIPRPQVPPVQYRLRNFQSTAMFAVLLAMVLYIAWGNGGSKSVYGIFSLAILVLKFVGSTVYRPVRGEAPDYSVAVVVPVYNEDPDAFRDCLNTILAQTRPADEIWVVDDGSGSDACIKVANEVLHGVRGVVIHKFEENAGKRFAQGYALTRTKCDIVVTLDSDTILDRSAIAEGLRPFADPKVNGVTGTVRALNHRKNLLTRLIEVRYANAFRFERAAYSSVGSVICCCGSLSLFRVSVLRPHLDDFLNQTFLGVHVQYGDDRRMTQYALLEGKVYLQDTAVAYTLVPEKLSHFTRQQVRWNKSFFRESLWAIRTFGPNRWPFWISLSEVVIGALTTLSLMLLLYIKPLASQQLMPLQYLAFAVLLSYARNVRYFGRPGDSFLTQLSIFAVTPVYAALHAVLLTPLRFWALCTLRQGKWGTRTEVEVST
jgi:hyaluronan synthase